MKSNSKPGIATLIIVMAIAFISSFIILIMESRVIMSISRKESAADRLLVEYRGESFMNDYLAIFKGGYPNFNKVFSTTIGPLADGTTTTLTGTDDGTTVTITANVTSTYATNGITLTRVGSPTGGQGKDLDVEFVTDCSSSMYAPSKQAWEVCCKNPPNINPATGQPYQVCQQETDNVWKNPGPSDPSYQVVQNYINCMNSGNGTGTEYTTRSQELANATYASADNLMDALNQLQIDNPGRKITLSWSIFQLDAQRKRNFDTNIAATYNLSVPPSIDSSRKRSMHDWIKKFSNSACSTFGGTSIGSGIDFGNNELATNPEAPPSPATKKQVTILMTDGNPNERYTSYTGLCNSTNPSIPTICDIYNSPTCYQGALDMVNCSLTNKNVGSKDPNVDIYVASIGDSQPPEVTSIFTDPNKVKKYYATLDATDLTNIFKEILADIKGTAGFIFTIKKS